MHTPENKLAELDEIESRLDQVVHRKARLTADLLTVSVLAPISFALDWHASRPLLMIGLMAIAIGVNHALPLITQRSLRRKRARLIEDLGQRTPLEGDDPA